jgi:hypothetical protein
MQLTTEDFVALLPWSLLHNNVSSPGDSAKKIKISFAIKVLWLVALSFEF